MSHGGNRCSVMMEWPTFILMLLKGGAVLAGLILGGVATLTITRDASGKLTRWGRTVLILIVASLLLALNAQVIEQNLKDTADAAANRKASDILKSAQQAGNDIAAALQKQKESEDTIKQNVEQTNAIRNQTGEIQNRAKEIEQGLEKQRERFSRLLARANTIGQNTSPVVASLSFTFLIPGDQDAIKPFLARLDASDLPKTDPQDVSHDIDPDEVTSIFLRPGRPTFPNRYSESEKQLYNFLSDFWLSARFDKRPINAERIHVFGIGTVTSFPNTQFNISAHISMTSSVPNSSTTPSFPTQQNDHDGNVYVDYEPDYHRIVFHADRIRLSETPRLLNVSTWSDLSNYYVLVLTPSPQRSSPIRIELKSLTLETTSDSHLTIRGFKPFSQDGQTLQGYFLATVPRGSKWIANTW
jgi:hypothetical protein